MQDQNLPIQNQNQPKKLMLVQETLVNMSQGKDKDGFTKIECSGGGSICCPTIANKN